MLRVYQETRTPLYITSTEPQPQPFKFSCTYGTSSFRLHLKYPYLLVYINKKLLTASIMGNSSILFLTKRVL